jgi:hypothetical protein
VIWAFAKGPSRLPRRLTALLCRTLKCDKAPTRQQDQLPPDGYPAMQRLAL